MKEFDFIRRYLARHNSHPQLIAGIGDDAAVIRPRPGKDLHISSDLSLAGRHFFTDVSPEDLAYKILAVNLSDMAAMGAEPRFFLLSAALPELEAPWLDDFFVSLFTTAKQYGVTLIGGDTTKGPSVFNITIMGETDEGKGLMRSGARAGDEIWVSGSLGGAAAALEHHGGNIILPEAVFAVCENRRLRPLPRVALGKALIGIATAALDVSDGFAQDLGHILNASGAGAVIRADDLPAPTMLKKFLEKGGITAQQLYDFMLAGGDDYELIFTAPANRREAVIEAGRQTDTPVTCVGAITESAGLVFSDSNGRQVLPSQQGFDHFG